MLVKTLMDEVAVSVSSTETGSTVLFHMPKSNRGIASMRCTSYDGSGNLVTKVEGRLSSSMEWVQIVSKNLNADETVTEEDLQLYPEMRATCTAAAGCSGTVTVQVGG